MVWLVVVSIFAQSFPAESVWVSSLFLFIGGGPQVSKSLIVTIVSESTKVVERSKALYTLAAIRNLTSLAAPVIASIAMRQSIWLPFAVGGLTWIMSIGVVVTLPGTKDDSISANRTLNADSIDGQDELSRQSPDMVPQFDDPRKPLLGKDQKLSHSWQRALVESLLLFRTSGLAYPLLFFFFKKIAFGSEAFLPQFASEKFVILLSDTAWLRAIQAVAASFVNVFANPYLTEAMVRAGYAPPDAALHIVRCSLGLLMVGFLLCWWAKTLWVLTIGALAIPFVALLT